VTAFKLWLVLMALRPPYGEGEPLGDRALRLWTVATAIDDAALETDYPGEPDELRAALLAVGYYESRYSRRIHAGDCHAHECDDGLAVGPWQVWPLWYDVEQSRGVGTSWDATFVSARAAAQALADGRRRCGTLDGALAAYATGTSCDWHGANRRARLAFWVGLIL